MIGALLTAHQGSASFLEIVHADSGKRGCGVVLGRVVVHFMDGHSGVDHVGFDGLLVDHRLDGLVDVMVLVLARHSSSLASRTLAFDVVCLIHELGSLVGKTAIHVLLIVMLKGPVLDRHRLMMMLLGQGLGVIHRLHRGVVVVLVDLLVNDRHNVLVLGTRHLLLCHSRGDLFVNSSFMVARAGHELFDRVFSGLHCGRM